MEKETSKAEEDKDAVSSDELLKTDSSEKSIEDEHRQGKDVSELKIFKAAQDQGEAIKFSPLNENRLAASFGNEFGHEGEGWVYIVERDDVTGELSLVLKIDCRDHVYDVCWSEKDQNILATACGNGFVQMWNLGNKYPKVATHEFKGHKQEMSCLDWNAAKFSDLVLAGCWDGTVSTYDIISQWPVNKLQVSDLHVNGAVWSPHSPRTFISASSDGVLQLWDISVNPPKASIFLSASDEELLCCDWSKYYPWLVATSGTDSIVKGWDIRNYSLPLFVNDDHGQAVKRIKFSPWHQTLIASASYDSSVRLFDYQVCSGSLETFNHHNDAYVYGLDWNYLKRGELASCGWDSQLAVFTPTCLKS